LTFSVEFEKLKKLGDNPDKEKMIAELFDKMETNLTYLGCTAIEDKL
jgi:hypothetical protein